MKGKSLIFIAILAAFLLNLAACCVSDRTPFSRESHFEKSYSFPEVGKVSLKNENGPVYIKAWDHDEVKVTAKKVVKAATREMANEASKKIKIEVDYRQGDIHIYTRNPYKNRGGDISDLLAGRKVKVNISFELFVPRNIEIKAKTMNGRMEAEGTEGKTDISTMNGRIVIVDGRGDFEAETMNGSIKAEILKTDLSDKIKLSTMNGSIRLYLPEDIKADIKAATSNGSVSSDLAIEKEESSSRRKLRGEINGGGTRIALETMNGSIKILKKF